MKPCYRRENWYFCDQNISEIFRSFKPYHCICILTTSQFCAASLLIMEPLPRNTKFHQLLDPMLQDLLLVKGVHEVPLMATG